MRLIYNDQRRRFEALGLPFERSIPQQAGFKFDPRNSVWYTDDKRTATLLLDYAGIPTRAKLNGVRPFPKSVSLWWNPSAERYESDCPPQLNKHPKAAGFKWDPKARLWWSTDSDDAFKLAQYGDETVRARLDTEIGKRAAIREASRAAHSDIEIPRPLGLDYMPFQKAGIQFSRMVLHEMGRHGVLIADEMGLGKTIQALGIINCDPSIKRVLVICPASLKLNWLTEAAKWLTRGFKLACLATKKPRYSEWNYATPGETLFYNFCVVNYDLLRQFHGDLRKQKWDLVIIDEVHYAKDPDAIRSREIYGYKKRGQPTIEPIPCEKVVCLTGTPIVNRPKEIWPIVNYCDPALFGSKHSFLTRYCGATQGRFGWNDDGATNLEELQDKLRTNMMVRRLKEQVLTDLPAKQRQVIELPVGNLGKFVTAEMEAAKRNEEQTEELRLAVERAKASEDPEEFKAAVEALKAGTTAAFAEIAILRHQTALAKLPMVIEHVKSALEDGRKLIIFAYHRDVMAELEKTFPNCAVIHGGVATGEARQQAVQRFQNDPSCKVFIGSVVAAAEGITLTAASHVIFAELDWRPGKLCQAEDRAHRIGQVCSVLVQHLVLEGSIDAHMARTIIEKQRVIERAMDKGYDVEDPDIPPVASEVSGASVPPVPGRDSNFGAATSGTSFREVADEASLMHVDAIEAIHECVRLLAGFDTDHAIERNSVGFNKLDVRLGHELAAEEGLTAKQAVLGKRILTRYRNTQLAKLAPDLVGLIWGQEENV